MKRTVNPRSLENLRSWQKGESGNPGGRPKRVISEAYQAKLLRVHEKDRQKRTYAELIAEAQVRRALKGDTAAAKEIADRTEGKARQSLDLLPEAPLNVDITVKFVDSDGHGAQKEQ